MEAIILIKIIILSIIEGLTEFIPVSSTGHLLVMSELLNFHEIPNSVFEISIQFGAILAVIFVYREKLWRLSVNFYKPTEFRFISMVAIATLPALVIGAIGYGFIKARLFHTEVIGCALIIGGVVIYLIEKLKLTPKYRDLDSIRIKSAILVGFFQILAMIPGVSRSGSTIIGGMAVGFYRKTAVEFSFFLAIPTIIAATLYDIYKNYEIFFTDKNLEVVSLGVLFSFFSSLAVIKWLLSFVQTHNFKIFAFYRIIAGIIILLL